MGNSWKNTIIGVLGTGVLGAGSMLFYFSSTTVDQSQFDKLEVRLERVAQDARATRELVIRIAAKLGIHS